MKKKTVLVTGGGGFIGSHLCERLLQEGFDVICLDNFFTGTKNNVRHLLSNPSFEMIRHDITVPISLEVDAIYNLACPASPVHYQHDPVQTARTNVLGAINMLELARRVNPIGIRSCYDEGKRCAETLFFDYHRQYDLPIKVIRIFNTYGPRMLPNDGRVVSNFIVQALAGKNITIYGTGNQTRSFCFVSDLIEGMIRMMKTPARVTGPVNLGNPGEYTVRELAEKIIRLSGTKSKLEFHPLPQDDPTRRKPDISLARELLNWEPEVGIDDGLVETINYFKNRKD